MSLVEEAPTPTLDASDYNMNDYWAIDPDGMAWSYVLARLTRAHKENAGDFLIGLKSDGTIRYFLNRKTFTAVELAKALGTTPEKIANVKVITLPAIEKKPRADQPMPTVPYYGEA